MSIYQPAEDSYLLSEALENYLKKASDKKIKILDIGSGSGIQAENCRKLGFSDIIATDIDPESIEILKGKNFLAIKSNLFSNIKSKEKFDLIIFNPPYLPEDKSEPEESRKVTTGGKKGYELVLKFLDTAKNYLNKNGRIFLLISSLTNPLLIEKQLKKLGYNFNIVNKKKVFFEELFVYTIFIKA